MFPVFTPPSRRSAWRAEFLVAATAIICFLNVLPNDFSHDDDPIVRFNEKVNKPGNWFAIWTTDYWTQARDKSPNRDLLYRPVALTSYRLVRMVAGPHPLPQHLVNVLLHAMVAALLVRLSRRMGLSDAVSLATGVLFAVLPIHSEVVAGVVGRADILATLGVLLTLLAHRGLMLTVSPTTSVCFRIAAAFAAFTAMGAKENGVSVIPLVVIWDAFQSRLGRGSDSGLRWWHSTTVRRLAYLVAPAALYFGLRYYALEGHLYQRPALTKTINVLVDAPPWQQILGVLQLWGMYWAKTLWPSVLCVNYSINSIRLATSPLDPNVLLGTLAALALIIGAVMGWRKNNPAVALLSAAIVVSYAPTANALVLMQVYFAERVWYLPSVWASALIAFMAARAFRVRVWRAIAIVLVLAMTARCWIRNTEWRDNGTLYAAAYRDQPDAAGCLYLYGQWLVNNSAYEDGVTLLKRAIEIDMGYTDAHRALGQAHFLVGDWREAVRHLQIAEMQVPGHAPTALSLDQASRELTLLESEEVSRRAQSAADRPDDVETEIALIRKMRELGRIREAIQRFQGSESRFSTSALWQSEYAVTLVYVNDPDAAIVRYLRAIELSPDDPQRMVEVAMLLLERRQKGDLDRAWELAKRASILAPGAPFVLTCRAELLAQRGDLQGAVAAYQEAIRALSPASDQRRVLEQRVKTLGRQ